MTMNHAKLNTKFASNVENKDILKNAVTTFLFTTAASAEAMTTIVAATAIQNRVIHTVKDQGWVYIV